MNPSILNHKLVKEDGVSFTSCILLVFKLSFLFFIYAFLRLNWIFTTDMLYRSTERLIFPISSIQML